MSYQVIARKYRPQRFEDVVGQEHVTQTLANAVRQGRIAHAYMFCGPRGTGKTTVARIFAKCLNCKGGPKVEFAEDDPQCVEIAEGRSLDVLEIDGASNNGVEQVRDLRETVKYAPASSKFKIYIIDEVHMLSVAAFNALLKTLEEPPGHVKFLFATTDPEKVLPTILSRCQRFDLRRIPAALMVRHMAKIAQAEAVTVGEAALYAIARGAEGSLRDAESTLDQLISLCGSEIGEADVLSMFGLASRAQVLTLAEAVLGGDTAVALRELEGLARGGKDLGRLLTDLLNHFRNLLVYEVSRGDLQLLEASEAEVAALKAQAEKSGAESVARVLEVLSEAESRFGDAVSKKIALEVTLWRAIQARAAVSVEAVLQRLTELRKEATEGIERGSAEPDRGELAPMGGAVRADRVPAERTEAAAGPPAAPAGGSVPMPDAAAPPALVGAQDIETIWSGLLEAVGRVSPFTRSYLLKAFPVSLAKNVLVVGFEPEFASYLPLVDNPKNHTLLQTKLKELGRPDTGVKFTEAKSPPPRTRTAEVATGTAPTGDGGGAAAVGKAEKGKATRLDPAEFKNDPLIKQALEVFRGHIVEVRA